MHATPPRRRVRPAWIWSGLALAAAVGLTGWLIRLQESACAAVDPGGTRTGRAVYYVAGSDVACSYRSLPRNRRYVSVAPDDYAGASACGSYLDVSGPRGRTVRVQVVDRCVNCVPGRLDLSRDAFAEIADPAEGDVPVRYAPVRDPQPVPQLGFEVKPGSSPDWLALLVTGNGNPLRRVELHAGRGWRPLEHGLDNYWTLSGAGDGPYGVRVTDTYGHRSAPIRVDFAPGEVQGAGVRLYDTEASPSPSVSESSVSPSPTSPSATPSSAPPRSTASHGCTRRSLALRT